MLRLSLAMLMLFPFAASAADDSRISFLEQEVRNLQRQVLALTRQVDEMRTRPDRPAARPAAQADTSASPSSTQWVDASRWQRIRPGMSEIEVIGTLGPPTSMREEGDARVLLYAMEIGESGFLGGSVKFRNRIVVEIRKPALQ